MAWRHGFAEEFSFCTPITTGTGNTTLVAAPGAGRTLRIQALTICVTTAAGQAFDIEDSATTIELFKAPASLAVGTYACDPGPLGKALTAATGLVYTATAGVGLTVSGFGWIQES
jgi:hypothetical protein